MSTSALSSLDSFTGYRVLGYQLLCSQHFADDFYPLLLLLRCVMSGLPCQSFASIKVVSFALCSAVVMWIYFYLSFLVFIYDPKLLGIL